MEMRFKQMQFSQSCDLDRDENQKEMRDKSEIIWEDTEGAARESIRYEGLVCLHKGLYFTGA